MSWRLDSVQMVILAGGLGTRLRPLTQAVTKAMLPINGRPFLEHQLDLLRQHRITNIVLCVGYLGEQVKAHFGDGRRFGLHIRYSEEGGQLLGTAGAVSRPSPCSRRSSS